MTTKELLTLIKTQPKSINFDDIIAVINNEYTYSPTRFSNGCGDAIVINESGSNEGSCKIFSFAKLQQLSKQQTLDCFGKYYREDVLKNPDGHDHANIRTLMIYSLDNIKFDNPALVPK